MDIANSIKVYAAKATSSSFQYTSDFPQNIDLARDILIKYSKIAPERVDGHIKDIHDKASQHSDPYPCIINYQFLRFHISHHPLYPTIVNELSAPGSDKKLLDLGTAFGQDLRVFAYHGAPSKSLFGSDLHQEFIDWGFELFQDRDKLGDNIVAGDIFANSGSLDQFKGKMDFISATAFIHLFSWEDQLRVGEKMISFLEPFKNVEESKQIIFGRQTATVNPGVRVREHVPWGQKELFLHDKETFKKLWAEVGEKTETKWKVTTDLRPWQRDGVKGVEKGETVRLLVFSLERIA